MRHRNRAVPMAPSAAVIVRRRGPAHVRLHRALADAGARTRHLHRAESGRARQRIFRSQPNAQPAATTVATNGGSRIATYQMTPAQFLAATGVPLGPAWLNRASICWPRAPSTAIASTSWTCGWPRCCDSAASG